LSAHGREETGALKESEISMSERCPRAARRKEGAHDGGEWHDGVAAGSLHSSMAPITKSPKRELDLAQALSLLEASEQRYREVFDKNPAIKIILDPESGDIVDANAAACAFYGYDKPTLCSMRIQDINTLPEERIRRELARAREEQRLFFSFKHRLANGEVREMEVYTGPVTFGERKLLHSILIDVTDRKRLQDQLLQAQRMEAMGRMAGGVAHDFNNLLTVVLTCVELAKATLPASHPASDAISEIESAAMRGAGLTQQLLALARKRVVEPQVLNLGHVVSRMTGLLQRLIGAHVDMTVEQDDAVWSTEVDPGQIEQVIVNLVVNARDAMPHGGNIEITTRNMVLKAGDVPNVPAGRWVEVCVGDSGVGMSREVRERIFEPFFTTKPPGQGTGLGLATVFGIVKQACGHLHVESEPNGGSRFHVYLPVVEGEPTAPAKSPSETPNVANHEVVLVVEDDEAIRRLLASTLETAGFSVLTAPNGEEACAVFLAAPQRVDLLLTDMVMPKMSGPELARRLLAVRTDLPVVFMSGYPSDLGEEPGALGARFLPKPFSQQAVLELVRSALRHARNDSGTAIPR